MNNQYEVLNPWAEIDPIPFRGIFTRLTDLTGKKIGLFCNSFKKASHPILTVVERKLNERFPTSIISWFESPFNIDVTETDNKARFEKWLTGVDAVISAVGD